MYKVSLLDQSASSMKLQATYLESLGLDKIVSQIEFYTSTKKLIAFIEFAIRIVSARVSLQFCLNIIFLL